MRSKTSLVLFLLILLALIFVGPMVQADDDDCLMCHEDPDLQRVEGGIPKSLHVSASMLTNSVHGGFSCVDCHTSLDGIDDFPHEAHLPGVNCADCHEDAFDEYMTGFYDHLNQRGFTTIPGCVQCHGTHEISSQADTRKVCGVCHASEVKKFDKSVHAPGTGSKHMTCTSCHSAHDKGQRGSMQGIDWRQFTVQQCLNCHEKQSSNYLESHHYKQVKVGNSKAPICTDCHSFHDVFAVDDPRSPVHVDKLDQTCDQCHSGHAATIHRKSGVDAQLMTCVACHTGHTTEMDAATKITFYDESLSKTCNRCHADARHAAADMAHSNIMMATEGGKTSNCTDCHVYHYKIPDDAHMVKAQALMKCESCHKTEYANWERSAHGISARKGHAEAPTCQTCHGEKQIQSVSERFDGPGIISLCSDCHGNRDVIMRFQLNPNVVSGYMSTFHGKMYALGYQGEDFATCTSCHDYHLVLPSDNPESTISQTHIMETCGKCHENVNENFVKMLSHYDPMAAEDHPVLDVIHIFMVWLLRITLTIFGLHTILWLVRSAINRIKHGPKKKIHKPYRYKRFGAYDRFLHALVITSFLTLALTGLPLKYSHTEISYWIANHLLSLEMMALLHRIGAVMTFTYFALHLGSLVAKLALRKVTLKQMFWGPDSLVPQPKDAVQFFQHIGYFLGISKKPVFERFSYWEKFDYMAVFWGVAVIGASGLTLWFPTLFTKLLPGWFINAAHIIHSEEALLATGFIFTIHFFNEHMRPENFPMDEVIFTGSIHADYLEEDRRDWYDRLEKQGKISKMQVQPMHIIPRVLLYIFGFASLAIGFGLLVLIVLGTFTGAH